MGLKGDIKQHKKPFKLTSVVHTCFVWYQQLPKAANDQSKDPVPVKEDTVATNTQQTLLDKAGTPREEIHTVVTVTVGQIGFCIPQWFFMLAADTFLKIHPLLLLVIF